MEEELFAELQTTYWDVVLLSETWREHMFCGSGGSKGSSGVGILLHRRWSKGFKAFHAVCSRVCAIDVCIQGCAIRFISVYMPHGGCDDAEVEGTYWKIEHLLSSARKTNLTCVLLGDWNAVVGRRQTGDAEVIVGPFGIGHRNERGNWVVEWAMQQKLAIASTLIEKSLEQQWTYENGGIRRQLDYCLMDVKRISWTLDAI